MKRIWWTLITSACSGKWKMNSCLYNVFMLCWTTIESKLMLTWDAAKILYEDCTSFIVPVSIWVAEDTKKVPILSCTPVT